MILTVVIIGAALLATIALCLLAGWLIGRHRDPGGAGDAEAHMAPLRREGPAEKTLVTDLRQRRMLLRPRGLSERKAALLAAKVTRRTMRARGIARMRHPHPAAEDVPPLVLPYQSHASLSRPRKAARRLPLPVRRVLVRAADARQAPAGKHHAGGAR